MQHTDTDMSRTTDERIAHCRRIATIAAVATFMGTVMLVARLVGEFTDLSVPELLGPLGVLLLAPGWIVTLAANQLAERYTETAQNGGHSA